ncbi:sensor histidine kinase [Dokdonella sp. MW10]|uniref:sensor histidine kinase n=1 Tax=Dokdonella sp. MW10 TaxID=2992926 RepID=UPI003F7E883B
MTSARSSMLRTELPPATPPPAPPPASDLATLLRDTTPLASSTPTLDVSDRLLDARHAGLLSLPIVDDGIPVGAISRYALMRVLLMPYGRELYGKRPIASLANREALVLPASMPIDEAARLIAERIPSPITEDFIVVDDTGRYLGTGVVLDVLRAMDARLGQRTRELERAYARVKSSQLQLVQSEKMASLGQMVAGLVHEINTPLGYVRNNVEMTRATLADTTRLIGAYEAVTAGLLDGETPPDDLPERVDALGTERANLDVAMLDDTAALLDDTLHGLGQIGELVANLKDFSRLDQARTQKADLNQLVDSALRIVQHILKRRGIEVVRHAGEVPPIECSPAQINQVLLNLVNNAVQAIEHDGGRIVVRTHVMGSRALVLVEDNGKGIAEADLARIFDPFFTTKAVGQGTGLGLAIAHQIVEQHRGLIRVASTPGRGTRFAVALPLEREAVAHG